MSNIYENDKYEVVIIDDALGEDNKYGRRGYAVVNKETSVVEHTTIVLPQALFQADAFMGALSQLDDSADDDAVLIEDTGDVTIQ
jgi:hypothetical protein